MSVKFFQPEALRKYNPPEKYSRTYDEDTYIFHINQIYTNPEKTCLDSKIKQLPIWKIITGKWTSGEFAFEHSEFIIAVFSLEFTVFNMMNYIDIMQYAGGSGLIIYIVLSIIIPTPIIIYYTFLSMYSRMGLIRFWNSVPMGQGFAYSYIVYKTMSCIMHVPICGIFLWHILKIIANDPMETGAFIAFYGKTHYFGQIGCPNLLPNITPYGSMVYLRETFNYMHGDQDGKFFLRWWLLSITVWIIIYTTMLCGFRRIYKILHKINLFLIASFFIPITLYMIYINRNFEFKIYNKTNVSSFEFWLRMGDFLLQGTLPGIYMTFGAVTKPGLIPEVGILWIYILQTFLFCVSSIIASLVQEQLHFIYTGGTKCEKRFSGVEIVMGIFAELVTLQPIGGYAILLYYMFLLYWSICSILYTLHGLLETMFLTYPKITKYRLFISTGLLCYASLVTAVMFVSNSYFSIYIALKENGIFLFTYFMVILMVCSILIYSTRRYENDYYFDYSRRMRPFVKFGIQLSIIFCIIVVIMYLLNGITHMDFSTMLNTVVNLVVFISLTPVAIYIGITEYQTRGHKVQSQLKPTPTWGPANEDEKQSRRRCDPEREFKYLIELPCTHMCLQDSKWLNSERDFWKRRLYYFMSLRREADEEDEMASTHRRSRASFIK